MPDKSTLFVELAVTDADGQFKTVRKNYNADCGQTQRIGETPHKKESKKFSSAIIQGVHPNPAGASVQIELKFATPQTILVGVVDAIGNVRLTVLSSRAEVTVVYQTARHSELAEESGSRQQAARMNRARFLGKLGMTFFFIRLLVRDYLNGLQQSGGRLLTIDTAVLQAGVYQIRVLGGASAEYSRLAIIR